jgi:uncharacterized membrane protein YqaE (UPF0057 family)
MKKYILHILLITVTGILFSSCGNLSKLSITKRHYRSGYYVDFSKKNNTTTNSSVASLPARVKHQTIKTERIKAVSSIAGTTTIVNPERRGILQYNKSNLKKKGLINKTASTSSNQTSVETTVVANNSNKGDENNSSSDDVEVRVDADVSFVVIVLCAIFIPPLGVALMYGIHLYFWVDLILTLLFFIPGMIFALIVVLM